MKDKFKWLIAFSGSHYPNEICINKNFSEISVTSLVKKLAEGMIFLAWRCFFFTLFYVHESDCFDYKYAPLLDTPLTLLCD